MTKEKIKIAERLQVRSNKGISWKRTAENVYKELELKQQQFDQRQADIDQKLKDKKEKENLSNKIKRKQEKGLDIKQYIKIYKPKPADFCKTLLELEKYDTDNIFHDTFYTCKELDKPITDETEIIRIEDIADQFIEDVKKMRFGEELLNHRNNEMLTQIRKSIPKEQYDTILEQLKDED